MYKQHALTVGVLLLIFVFIGCKEDEGSDVNNNSYLFTLAVTEDYEIENRGFVIISDNDNEIVTYQEYFPGEQVEVDIPEGNSDGTYDLTFVETGTDNPDINTYLGVKNGQKWTLAGEEQLETYNASVFFINAPLFGTDYDYYEIITNKGKDTGEKQLLSIVEVDFIKGSSPVVVLFYDGHGDELAPISYMRFDVVANGEYYIDLSDLKEGKYKSFDTNGRKVYHFASKVRESGNYMSLVSRTYPTDAPPETIHYVDFEDAFKHNSYSIMLNPLDNPFTSIVTHKDPSESRVLTTLENVSFNNEGATFDMGGEFDIALINFTGTLDNNEEISWLFYCEKDTKSVNFIKFPEEIQSLLPTFNFEEDLLHFNLRGYSTFNGYDEALQYYANQTVPNEDEADYHIQYENYFIYK